MILLNRFLKDSEPDSGTILLVHRIEKGEFEDKYVRENTYLFKDEEKATDVIRRATMNFCHDVESIIDKDSEFSVDYDWVSGTRRSLTVRYKKDKEMYVEKLYLTHPQILKEGESK